MEWMATTGFNGLLHCWFEASANDNRTKVDLKCTEQIYTQTQRQSTEEEEEERECFLRPPIAFQINTPGRSPRSCWEAQDEPFVILAPHVL